MLFEALIGGAIGSAIASGSHGTGRYVVLKFKNKEECEKIVNNFNKKHGFTLEYPSYGTEYKKAFYQKIEIIGKGGKPELEKIFFVKENQKRVVKLFPEEKNKEKK